MRSSAEPQDGPAVCFYSVAQVARMFGVSSMTVYRAIAAGQFPAVRMRGRLIVPARAVEEMADRAKAKGALVDAASWVKGEPPARHISHDVKEI